jgi:hypothetical protein
LRRTSVETLIPSLNSTTEVRPRYRTIFIELCL